MQEVLQEDKEMEREEGEKEMQEEGVLDVDWRSDESPGSLRGILQPSVHVRRGRVQRGRRWLRVRLDA